MSYTVELRDSGESLTVKNVFAWFEKKGYFKSLQRIEVQLSTGQQEEGYTELCRTDLPPLNETKIEVEGRIVTLTRSIHRSWRNEIANTLEISVPLANRDFLDNIIEEARALSDVRPKDKLTVFRSDTTGAMYLGKPWTKFGPPRSPRYLDSVVLDQGIGESLLKDLKEFIQSKDWYAKRCLPYRRGYLLYGPPGCGKSSVVKALACELDLAVCVLNLTHKKMSDELLMETMCVIPNKSVVLLEDVDAIFGKDALKKKRKKDSKKSSDDDDCSDCDDQDPREGSTANTVTFSGLLNVIDGIAAADGRILFMTTNHIEKLDKALIRPGRVDRRQLITFPSEYQLKQLFTSFYEDFEESLVKEFVKTYKSRNLEMSVAEIQGHFMLFKNDPKKAIDLIGTEFNPADY